MAWLADIVVGVHAAYVATVVGGFVLIFVGAARGWRWVRNLWIRLIHLAMIGVVALESVCGVPCPLTVWEDQLRESAGETSAGGTFIGRWLHDLIFVDLSSATLTTLYILSAAVVAATLWLVPPRRPS